MEDLLAESKIELLKEGSVISGTIMEIRPTEVVIDFGGKLRVQFRPMSSWIWANWRLVPISKFFLSVWKTVTETLNCLLTRLSKRRIGKK